ncbi:hypothetical protein AB0H57_01290 [Micromonospora sp. NPDC050686]|uniref:hypothetical protein n=1 Tax=Micromonospora sp. NPDC050686 TaxID=3154631 RepID=UPI0033E44DD1
MHGRIGLAGVAVVLVVAGCGAEPDPVAMPAAAPVPVEPAAASSGGACRLLDFDTIAKHSGTRFRVAAASTSGDTHTCVVRGEKAWPELTLTVSDTSIDAATFSEDILPRGATKVPKLGQIGYRRTISAKNAKQGPAAEVCWLAAEGRLASLRWTFGPGAAQSAADTLTGKLVPLARGVRTREL